MIFLKEKIFANHGLVRSFQIGMGGMGKEALVFYRRLADRLSRHDSMSYSNTLAWIRCTLSFLPVKICYNVHPGNKIHLLL